ncbi:MAG: hypothetical protein BGO38_07855 [Cellulomonas sp. 73-145]|uniref:hypothetical protein n=1 Tax=Cellulomonas sp. 73-145 TaxID=1895739 RepID=UPI0009281755|nr:hypothetical protein [Cellulomonas sp. 73-145]OJV58106.1 MAG: hypothetical protein BGO38_07855 [Cellulomonas sp. 73-145]
MASGRSLELAQLKRRPQPLTTSRTDPFAVIGPDHTYTRDELEAAREVVRLTDEIRREAAAERWGR